LKLRSPPSGTVSTSISRLKSAFDSLIARVAPDAFVRGCAQRTPCDREPGRISGGTCSGHGGRRRPPLHNPTSEAESLLWCNFCLENRSPDSVIFFNSTKAFTRQDCIHRAYGRRATYLDQTGRSDADHACRCQGKNCRLLLMSSVMIHL